MQKFPWWAIAFLLLGGSVHAGQVLWTPGGDAPTLVLSLGDGAVKKSLDLPSGATKLRLTLKKFLLDDERLLIVWKTEGDLWLRQVKKIPGDEITDLVTLPPGRHMTLEITTVGGTPVASIKLQRK